jgi:hypothetical protein
MKNKFKLLVFTLSVFTLLISSELQAQWVNAASSSLPSGNHFATMAESGSGLYIGSLEGNLYYNNFSTGLSKSWTAIANPSGANSPISSICAIGTDVYVAWCNDIYLSTNSGASFGATPIATNFYCAPLNNNYYQDFNTQLFATDGTSFYYVANNATNSTLGIYKSTLGSTTVTTLNISPPYAVNCLYVNKLNGRLYAGTNGGLYSTSTSTVNAAWSNEFAGTSYSGYAVYQIVPSDYNTAAYPSGSFNLCSCATKTLASYRYPFYMVANTCSGECPTIIQQAVSIYGQGSASLPLGSCFSCTTCCTKYIYTTSISYSDNSRGWPFPTNSTILNFVTASGNASPAKIWGISTQSTGSEQGTYTNTSTWSTGSGGLTGLPTPFTNYTTEAALGSQNTYNGVAGYIFFSFNEPINTPNIYAESYSAAKTGDEDNGTIVTPSFSALDNSLNLFPNPTTGKITFDLSTLQSSYFSIKIYDQLGREVDVPASNSYTDAGSLKLDVDMRNMPTGIYFYKVDAEKWFYNG